MESSPSISRLARYAALASHDANGVGFRLHTEDLRGPIKARFLKSKGSSSFAQNTYVHLGIRDQETVVIVFGFDTPWLYEDYILRLESTNRFFNSVLTYLHSGLNRISWEHGPTNIWVHESCLATFDELRCNLLDYIRALLGREPAQLRISKMEICGYGLGGALATLCALWCATQWETEEIICVTLGSPRIGCESFVTEFRSRRINCYRLVASYPFADMPYQYRNEPLLRWQHVSEELLLPLPKRCVKSGGKFLSVFHIVGSFAAHFLLFGCFVRWHWNNGIKHLEDHVRLYVEFYNLVWLVVEHSPMVYLESLEEIVERPRE